MEDNYLEIMDYDDKKIKTKINLDKLDEIEEIFINNVSGDEIAIVFYKNAEIKTFDSGKCRIMDFLDGGYYLYSIENNINRIEEFLKRKDSYELLRRYG